MVERTTRGRAAGERAQVVVDHPALGREGRARKPIPKAPRSSPKAESAAAPAPAARGFDKKTIALVYDFDGTLSPRPMQEYSFLPQLGLDPKAFWAECAKVAREQEADPLITYMHLMYKKAREKGLRVDRKDLVAQGSSVELYPGVPAWFEAIGQYVKIRAESSGIALRHYLVSSGLSEIIEGTSIRKHFHKIGRAHV